MAIIHCAWSSPTDGSNIPIPHLFEKGPSIEALRWMANRVKSLPEEKLLLYQELTHRVLNAHELWRKFNKSAFFSATATRLAKDILRGVHTRLQAMETSSPLPQQGSATHFLGVSVEVRAYLFSFLDDNALHMLSGTCSLLRAEVSAFREHQLRVEQQEEIEELRKDEKVEEAADIESVERILECGKNGSLNEERRMEEAYWLLDKNLIACGEEMLVGVSGDSPWYLNNNAAYVRAMNKHYLRIVTHYYSSMKCSFMFNLINHAYTVFERGEIRSSLFWMNALQLPYDKLLHHIALGGNCFIIKKLVDKKVMIMRYNFKWPHEAAWGKGHYRVGLLLLDALVAQQRKDIAITQELEKG